MLRLDKILFDAIVADTDLMTLVGSRVKSTCFEVSPEDKDNTPLPYIVIRDLGKQPSQTTKDDDWMPNQWNVVAGVEVGAVSPNEVDSIVMKAMQAIANYISNLFAHGEEKPYLNEGFPKTQGVAWDWTKPCYWDLVQYQCDMNNTTDDEQNEE
jgi:hypothetical protein